MRQLIAVRRRLPQLASGRIEFLEPENHHVLAFLRSHDGHDPILVVANLSRLAQSVELDLRAHIGARPHELFGGHDFAPVGELPYYVTLSPYAIFWFRLSHRPTQVGEPSERELPTLDCTWDASRSGRTPPLLDALRSWMPRQRWFGSKDRAITGMSITADIPVGQRRRGDVRLVLVDVGYRTGEPDTYAVPLAVVSGHRAHWASTFEPESVVAALANENLIVDATCDSSALAALIRTLVRPSRRDDEIEADTTPALRRILRRITDDDVRRLGAEQSNTSLVVDDEVLIKLFRRVERGENPDLQISRHLAKVGLRHVPNPQGSLSRRRSRSEWDTLAIAYDFVPNEGDRTSCDITCTLSGSISILVPRNEIVTRSKLFVGRP
jgi:maltose alpha-D-glucosyltransferase/alpha-amylase